MPGAGPAAVVSANELKARTNIARTAGTGTGYNTLFEAKTMAPCGRGARVERSHAGNGNGKAWLCSTHLIHDVEDDELPTGEEGPQGHFCALHRQFALPEGI